MEQLTVNDFNNLNSPQIAALIQFIIDEAKNDEEEYFNDSFLLSVKKFVLERGYLTQKQMEAICNIYNFYLVNDGWIREDEFLVRQD